MENPSELRQKAIKELQIATYLLSTTYKLTQEPKALLSIADRVLDAYLLLISIFLEHERAQKLIPPYHETTESKVHAFRNYLVKKYDLGEYLAVVDTILCLSQEHKDSSVEFSRDRKFVICSDQFSKITTVSEDDIKEFIKKGKAFINVVDMVILHE